jgi:hypothetical protein
VVSNAVRAYTYLCSSNSVIGKKSKETMDVSGLKKRVCSSFLAVPRLVIVLHLLRNLSPMSQCTRFLPVTAVYVYCMPALAGYKTIRPSAVEQSSVFPNRFVYSFCFVLRTIREAVKNNSFYPTYVEQDVQQGECIECVATKKRAVR